MELEDYIFLHNVSEIQMCPNRGIVYVVCFIGFTYLLSLHQVGSKTDCVMCFGPMVPDGYGVCYNPMEEHINVAITAFNSCEETNAARFAQAVEGALLDMRGLLEGAAAPAEQ